MSRTLATTSLVHLLFLGSFLSPSFIHPCDWIPVFLMGHFLKPLIHGSRLVRLVARCGVSVAVLGSLWAQAWHLRCSQMVGMTFIASSLIHGAFGTDKIPVDCVSSNNFLHLVASCLIAYLHRACNEVNCSDGLLSLGIPSAME
jgi:hypothetical protein